MINLNDDNFSERDHSSNDIELERFRTELGRRLYLVREDIAAVSPITFAKTFGLGKSSVLRYESGERTPDAWFIKSVIERYHVSSDWLLTGNGSPQYVADTTAPYVPSEGEKKEWERQAAKFKEASKLAFEMSKSDPDANPGPVWSALVMELVTLYGLDDRGAQRLIETVQLLRDREKARNGPD